MIQQWVPSSTGSNAQRQWFNLVFFYYSLSNNAIDDDFGWQRKCPLDICSDYGIKLWTIDLDITTPVVSSSRSLHDITDVVFIALYKSLCMLDIQYLLRANFLNPLPAYKTLHKAGTGTDMAAKIRDEPGLRYLTEKTVYKNRMMNIFKLSLWLWVLTKMSIQRWEAGLKLTRHYDACHF